jgi:hypothetical protein
MPLPWISAFSFFGKYCSQTRWKLLFKPVAGVLVVTAANPTLRNFTF